MVYTHLQKIPPPVAAIIAATILFGSATPFLKLLVLQINPLLLIGLLGLGSTAGALFWLIISRNTYTSGMFPPLAKNEWYFLAGTTLIGGLVAPAIQLTALTITPAATASLLLNFEVVTTVLIAWVMFRETIGYRTCAALIAIFAGSVLLSWNGGTIFDFSIGAAGVILSCILWGLDNNCVGRISSLPEAAIAVIRGTFGGCTALVLALLLHESFPGWGLILITLGLGFFAYGLGLVLFIRALSAMGAARGGAIYAAAPFIGCVVSLIIFADPLGFQFWVALPLFIVGSLIIIHEQWDS